MECTHYAFVRTRVKELPFFLSPTGSSDPPGGEHGAVDALLPAGGRRRRRIAGLQFRRDQVRDEGVWPQRRQQGVRVWLPQVGTVLRQGRQGEL